MKIIVISNKNRQYGHFMQASIDPSIHVMKKSVQCLKAPILYQNHNCNLLKFCH